LRLPFSPDVNSLVSSQIGARIFAELLAVVVGCTLVLPACAPLPPTSERVPAATSERVSDYDIKHSRGGAQAYDLSPRERAICRKKASEGDIVAAKTLMEYYEMVVVDKKQYQHWLRVVERLQRAQR
jgi:hypothetical protein